MREMRWDRPWLRYMGVVAAYAVIYGSLHAVYISHWELTVGFRLACLLLVPIRYWPALFVGEAAALGKLTYECAEQLGLPWAVAFPFASMSLSMLVVYPLRKYKPVVNTQRRVNIRSLLLCIGMVTVASTLSQMGLYALMQGQPPALTWPAQLPFFAFLWFLGTALGIYMIVPLTLWAYSEGEVHLRNLKTRIVRSHVLLEAGAFLLPCLYLLAYAIEYSYSMPLRHIAQFVMLLSPLWFALRYGWQGASLGCMLANLAVVLSMPALYDPATLQIQTLMLVSSTLWLLLGARVSTIRLRLDSITTAH